MDLGGKQPTSFPTEPSNPPNSHSLCGQKKLVFAKWCKAYNYIETLGLCQCGISWPPWHALSGPTLNIQAYSNSRLPQTKTSQNGGFTLAALAAFSKPSGLITCRCDADRLRNALETLQVPLLLESNMSSAGWQRANTEIWLFFVVNCCKHAHHLWIEHGGLWILPMPMISLAQIPSRIPAARDRVFVAVETTFWHTSSGLSRQAIKTSKVVAGDGRCASSIGIVPQNAE